MFCGTPKFAFSPHLMPIFPWSPATPLEGQQKPLKGPCVEERKSNVCSGPGPWGACGIGGVELRLRGQEPWTSKWANSFNPGWPKTKGKTRDRHGNDSDSDPSDATYWLGDHRPLSRLGNGVTVPVSLILQGRSKDAMR